MFYIALAGKSPSQDILPDRDHQRAAAFCHVLFTRVRIVVYAVEVSQSRQNSGFKVWPLATDTHL